MQVHNVTHVDNLYILTRRLLITFISQYHSASLVKPYYIVIMYLYKKLDSTRFYAQHIPASSLKKANLSNKNDYCRI